MSESSSTPPEPATGTDSALLFPASFAQQRLWFLHKLIPDSPAYNIAMARLLTGPLNTAALQNALNQLLERHETLRTRFTSIDDEPMQVVAESATLLIDTDTLEQVDDETDDNSLRQKINALSAAPFDLENESLLRISLFSSTTNNSEQADHLLVIVIHHIIADAWSLDILFRELVQLYNSECQNELIELPELPIQYGDYADWQLEQVDSGTQQQQLEYWRNQLANAPAVLDLPTDRARPGLQSYNGDTLYRELSTELSSQVQAFAKQSGSTYFVVMLAAYSALLSR